MKYGFEIIEEEGRKGVEYACYRNGKQCTTGLCKPVSFKSRKSAENYISKQIAIYEADASISNEERAAIKAEAAKKEATEKVLRDAAIEERLRRKREEEESRSARARLNNALRARGYKWVNVGFKSEEDADAFDLNLPIGDDWKLVSPDGKVVSIQEAKNQIGW